jgi:hypothetical protein
VSISKTFLLPRQLFLHRAILIENLDNHQYAV